MFIEIVVYMIYRQTVYLGDSYSIWVLLIWFLFLLKNYAVPSLKFLEKISELYIKLNMSFLDSFKNKNVSSFSTIS